ncbi:MAG: hypothetical protein ACYDIA_13765 [Candidatus Humimicrobiaceae bacterium]
MKSKTKTTFRHEPVADWIFWGSILKRHQTAKAVRKLRSKFDFKTLSDLTGFKRQYIYGVQEMTIKPSETFINKLNGVLNSFKLDKESFKNLIEIKRF